MKKAIIDMGTNTFHLLLAEVSEGSFQLLEERKQAVRLGQGGISDGRLGEEAQMRAFACLHSFAFQSQIWGILPADILAYATSAVRSADNGQAFVDAVASQTGIQVQILDGPAEAGFIFDGVRASGACEGVETVLVMDIGGGSVEFILGKPDGEIHLLHSFELGAQRLLDGYVRHDPILPQEVSHLKKDLCHKLAPLQEACRLHPPTLLVGASGTFDTLRQLEHPSEDVTPVSGLPWMELSPAAVQTATLRMQQLDRAQRRAIRGISDLRADMIVVALILLEVALKMSGASHIRQCSYALKEGVVQRLAHP